MDNQHQHIKGYRDLSQDEIDLMNTMKMYAEEVGNAVERLEGCKELDQRFVAIGKTHLQLGFMAVIRGIAQPETF